MSLPKTKRKPVTDLMQYMILFYGKTKIGKTTLASKAPGALFLSTEPGTNALEVFEVQIKSWTDMLQALADVAAGNHDFKTLVIDTVDNMYTFCSAHVCAELNIKHPADLGHGKAYGRINNEFQRVLLKLAQLPYGLFLISHSQEIEIETRTGKYTKTTTTLPGGARKIVTGLVDFMLFCDVEAVPKEEGGFEHRRVIRTKPNTNYDAGDRTGKLPDVLPLDFKAFTDAFTNATKGKTK
jgi:hypothetical protein